MRSKTEYQDLYGRLKDFPLAVSRETGGSALYAGAKPGARTIVEFGTSFGISTLHLAAALRDNGGGRLITSEFEPSKVGRREEESDGRRPHRPCGDPEGDALQTLSADLPETIDLLLLDGAKALCPRS